MKKKLKTAIKKLNKCGDKYQNMIIEKHGKLIDDGELATISGYRAAWQNYLKLGGSTTMINK